MKIKYRKYVRRGIEKFNDMPIIHVRLKYAKTIIDIDCLVDSGAGDCVFNRDIADTWV